MPPISIGLGLRSASCSDACPAGCSMFSMFDTAAIQFDAPGWAFDSASRCG
jgi:hypothetical protein